MITLYNGDCLVEHNNIEDGSVDLILTDLPYGTTACSWDEIIPLSEMWDVFYRILRPNGFIVLTASQPFTSKLISSNINNFSHQWIWEKLGSNGNPLLANVMPLKNFEEVIVFSNQYKAYDYEGLHPLRDYFKNVMKFIGMNLKQINTKLGHRRAEHAFYINSSQFSLCTEKTYNELIKVFNIDVMEGFKSFVGLKEIDEIFKNELPSYERIYNPQMTKGEPYKIKQGGLGEAFGGTKDDNIVTENSGYRYPKSILQFGYDRDKIHPTQKPVALLEYLIKTYTNEGDLVVDLTMGSGSTGVACVSTNRKFIGIELDNDYFNIAEERINNYIKE